MRSGRVLGRVRAGEPVEQPPAWLPVRDVGRRGGPEHSACSGGDQQPGQHRRDCRPVSLAAARLGVALSMRQGHPVRGVVFIVERWVGYHGLCRATVRTACRPACDEAAADDRCPVGRAPPAVLPCHARGTPCRIEVMHPGVAPEERDMLAVSSARRHIVGEVTVEPAGLRCARNPARVPSVRTLAVDPARPQRTRA